MGIFFKSAQPAIRDPKAREAFRWALQTVPPASLADATIMVDQKVSELWPDVPVSKAMRLGLARAVRAAPPQAADLEAEADARAADAAPKGTPGDANLFVFAASAILLVVLLSFTTWVAIMADGQPKDLANSQLKTLSTALITAFTSLLGAIVGTITGEAVTKKDAA